MSFEAADDGVEDFFSDGHLFGVVVSRSLTNTHCQSNNSIVRICMHLLFVVIFLFSILFVTDFTVR